MVQILVQSSNLLYIYTKAMVQILVQSSNLLYIFMKKQQKEKNFKPDQFC
jgi:hypothetical protein